uniref:Bursicon n=1 Tax=Romanomermis culicivorax TaxID=13658 RepID=A0A915J3C4_ROMCU
MILDGREPATVINEGTTEFMQISSGVSNRKVYTYLGGVPDDLHDQILKLYHLKDVSSLLAASPDADACLRHECVNGAECKPMVGNGQSPTTSSSSDESVGVNKKKNYVCQCRNGFKGQFCQERAKKCVKRKFTEIHKQDGCRSKRPVKKAVCLGQCFELYNNNNNDKNLTALQREGKMCCKPVKSRKKRLTLHCGGGGGKKTKNVIFDVIRKCDCQRRLSPKII